MIKLEAAYDSMPKSDERRASLSARTAQNTTMPLPALEYSRLRMQRRGMPKRAVAAKQSRRPRR